MKRRLAVLILVISFVGLYVVSGFAYGNQHEHDKDLKYVLFGRDAKVGGKEKKQYGILKDAAALCIDQFSQNDGDKKEQKKQLYIQLSQNVKGLPDFSEIDLNSKQNNGVNIGSKNHRSFTHKGWNHYYKNDKEREEYQEFWERRKTILKKAVRQAVFSKSDNVWDILPWKQKDYTEEQVEAFCILVYNVHIIGDHKVSNDKGQIEALLALWYLDDNNNGAGIIPELLECVQVLFPTQNNRYKYFDLVGNLKECSNRAETNYYAGRKGIHTEAEIEKNKMIAKELLDALIDYIPQLLSEEPFFQNAFSN